MKHLGREITKEEMRRWHGLGSEDYEEDLGVRRKYCDLVRTIMSLEDLTSQFKVYDMGTKIMVTWKSKLADYELIFQHPGEFYSGRIVDKTIGKPVFLEKYVHYLSTGCRDSKTHWKYSDGELGVSRFKLLEKHLGSRLTVDPEAG